jgi:hypothetical protein
MKAPAGVYSIVLSLITPNIQLTSDGKTPSVAAYSGAIAEVIGHAMRQAHRLMERPKKKITIKDAAWACFPAAYDRASGGRQLPPSARQVFYAARPEIMKLTGLHTLDSKYITQTLLPDFEAQHPEQTAEWDVTYDARGNLIEPHTGLEVGLGTLEVRDYLNKSAAQDPAVILADRSRWNTAGPEHRFRTVLFVEKEGFTPLLQRARIAERFDVMLMSTKGMSVVAARRLLDGMAGAGHIDRVLVAHDFDVSGFSIFATVGGDNRRYKYLNKLPFHDIGLRLTDVEEMGLQSEPVMVKNWAADSLRMTRRGVTEPELAFLRTKRVELNAMTAPQFVAFLERKLVQHGAAKVVPPEVVLIEHAQRILARKAAERWLATMPDAALPDAPDDLIEQVRAMLAAEPTLSWDIAVAATVRR